MKLNGKNIITSSDVTIDGVASNLGNTLDSILVLQLEDLSKLKSNVKWLYKYGGVGSGGGGGTSSGSTSGWSIIATLNSQSLDNEKLILKNGVGQYSLNVKISKPQGGTYSLQYRIGNRAASNRYVLSLQENAWNIELALSFSENTNLHVEVTDLDGEIKTLDTSIIVNAYTITSSLVNTDGITYNNNSLFIDTVKNEGLLLKVSHSLAVNFDYLKINVTFQGYSKEVEIQGSSGDTLVNLVEMLPYELSADDAGVYNYQVDYFLKLSDNTEAEEIESTVSSVNLIPTGFYVLVTCNTGSIYTKDTEEHNLFQTGIVNLQLTAYNGLVNSGNNYSVNVTITDPEGGITEKIVTLKERTNTTYSLNCNIEGTYIIKLSRSGFEKYTYLYTSDKYKNIDYFLKSIDVYELFQYKGLTSDSINLTSDSIYKMSGTSEDKVISGLSFTKANDIYNTLVNIGIKYNRINTYDNPILTITTKENGKTVVVYANKIVFFDSEKQVSIRKASTYNLSEDENFQLITLCSNNVDSATEALYQRTIYIDGRLESGINTFTEVPINIDSITLHSGNYQINLIDVAYISPQTPSTIDLVASNYDLAYHMKKLHLDEYGKEILNILLETNALRVEKDNVILSSSAVANLSQASKIPTILCSIPYKTQTLTDGTKNIGFTLENIQSNLGNAGSSNPTLSKQTFPINFYYAEAGVDVTSDLCKRSISSIYEFYLKFLGTSTLLNKSKNYFIGIRNISDDLIGISFPVFTPNYSVNDSSSFLPETGFNLKSDVVDSSHSVNNACGSFVNKEIPRIFSDVTYKYNDLIKNCLEGFPVLMFVNFEEENGQKSLDYYYLGIYNFNLGRDSYYNLGYSDLDVALDGNTLSEGFLVYTVKGSNSLPIIRDGMWVAEIQENREGFDFSLFDSTVLFPQNSDNQEDTGAMFGDFVTSLPDNEMQAEIKSFVKSVTDAGAYTFEAIGKNFGDPTELYGAADENGVSKNQVPTYKLQYKRDGTKLINPTKYSIDTSDPSLLTSLIYDNEVTGTKAKMNYESFLYYFVTVMALGLVDSPCKNMNLKKFVYQIVAAFYDMDTAFGKDNAGRLGVSTYAFTDYWLPNNDGSELKNATIYRDYKPLTGFSGYDIPSSYLFAIVKYASTVLASKPNLDPLLLWNKWRNVAIQTDGLSRKGPFYTADTFIEEFFTSHTNGIENILKNLNYRYKYFVYGDGLFDTNNFTLFNGTCVEQVRDWLNTRFHLLDMMFNQHGGPLKITKYNLETKKYEETGSYYCNSRPSSDNPDVLVCHEIFSSTGTSFKPAGGINAVITAMEYSPLTITSGESLVGQYILEDPKTEYKLQLSSLGAQATIFGGSSMWQTINNVDSFVQSDGILYINSDYLQTVKSTNKTISSATLITPAVKTVSITNANSTGKLSFEVNALTLEDSYPNLETIDISGTKMSLSVNGESVKSININNSGSTSSTIEITNCDSLVTLNKNYIKADSFTLACGSNENIGKNVTFSLTEINKMVVSTSCEDATLTINTDRVITSLEANGFSKIVISSCPNLQTIILGSPEKLKSLSVNSCNTSNTFSLNSENIENLTNLSKLEEMFTFVITSNTSEKGVVNLSECVNLTSLSLNNTQSFYKVILPESGVKLGNNTFYNTSLRFLDGKAILNGTEIFKNTPVFQLRLSNGSSANMTVADTCTSIANCFYNESTTIATDITDVQNFFNNCLPSSNVIASVSGLFRNRGISYTLDEINSDLALSKSRLVLKNLPNCTNASYLLFGNPIYGYNKYMFDSTFGSSEKGIGIGDLLGYKVSNNASGYYVTLDFLENIADKVTSFGNWEYNYHLLFNSKYVTDSVVPLKKIFAYNFPKLTTLASFSIYETSKTVDFSDLFNSKTESITDKASDHITTIYRFILTNIPNVANFDELFKPLKNLKIFQNNCLNISSVTADWFNLFDWETLLKNYSSNSYFGNAGFSNTNSSSYFSLSIKKKINQENYKKLWNLINTYKKWTSLSAFFKNCTFDGFYDLTIPSSNSTLTSVILLYQGASTTVNNGYLLIDSSFCTKLPNVKQFYYTFAGIKWYGYIPFNFFNTRQVSTKTVYVDRYEDEETVRKEATLYTYGYASKGITMSYCFSGTTFSIPFFNDTTLPEKNHIELDGKEVEDSIYYINEETSVPDTITINTEYTDCADIGTTQSGSSSNYSQSVTIDNVTFDIVANPRLFVSPDIWYSVDSSIPLTGVFLNSNLMGLIPLHLTNKCSASDISYSLSGLNIYPRQVLLLPRTTEVEGDEDRYLYLFVPDGFTTRSNISNFFNFLIRIPIYNSSDDVNDIYLVLGEKSVSKNLTAATNAFPSSLKTSIEIYNYTANCKYNIMGIYNDGEVTFGIPKTYCNGFVYSGVINSTLAKVLYGEVFPNVIFNGSTNIGSSPVISLYHTISPNFILPRNTQLLNSSNKVLLQATVAYTGSKVSIKTSLLASESDLSIYKLYSNVSFT